jgi:hypothetical protein
MCFNVDLRNNSDYFLYSINLLVFIAEAECLLRGTNWVFKSESYSFVLKKLNFNADGLTENRHMQWTARCNSVIVW